MESKTDIVYAVRGLLDEIERARLAQKALADMMTSNRHEYGDNYWRDLNQANDYMEMRALILTALILDSPYPVELLKDFVDVLNKE